jgi:hypothetical protein
MHGDLLQSPSRLSSRQTEARGVSWCRERLLRWRTVHILRDGRTYEAVSPTVLEA